MSHVGINEVSYPVTIIECPPLRVFGIRFYKLNPKIAVADLYNKDIDKELSRKTKISNGKETNDFDDIRTIIEKDKNFNWDYFLDEVVWQAKNGDSWVALDSEKMMKELKKYVFVPEKYFKRLYGLA